MMVIQQHNISNKEYITKIGSLMLSLTVRIKHQVRTEINHYVNGQN